MNVVISQKLDSFFTAYKHLSYKKGEILIRADDNPSGISYIKQGYVKQYAISKKGDELVVNIFKPGSFFPMSWAINQTPNSYFFEAMTEIEVWRCPREKIIVFLKDNPDVLFDLLSRVYKGTDGLLTRMTYLMSGNAYSRLIIELLIYAKRFENGKDNVPIDVSEKDLAAQAGMTRETVSREMRLLKDKKLIIMTNNKLVIPDIVKLEEELADGV